MKLVKNQLFPGVVLHDNFSEIFRKIPWKITPTKVFCEKVLLKNFTKFTGKHLFLT